VLAALGVDGLACELSSSARTPYFLPLRTQVFFAGSPKALRGHLLVREPGQRLPCDFGIKDGHLTVLDRRLSQSLFRDIDRVVTASGLPCAVKCELVLCIVTDEHCRVSFLALS